MKKIYSILIAGILISAGIAINSCKKDKVDVFDTDNCDKLADAYYQAAIDYTSDRTDSEKCQNFVDAATDYINNCGILTPEQKREFQEEIDETDCSN
jgi:hypothetical protein